MSSQPVAGEQVRVVSGPCRGMTGVIVRVVNEHDVNVIVDSPRGHGYRFDVSELMRVERKIVWEDKPWGEN